MIYNNFRAPFSWNILVDYSPGTIMVILELYCFLYVSQNLLFTLRDDLEESLQKSE